jgi:hypothetical protein
MSSALPLSKWMFQHQVNRPETWILGERADPSSHDLEINCLKFSSVWRDSELRWKGRSITMPIVHAMHEKYSFDEIVE